MLNSGGFRVSVAGGLLVAISMLGLVFLPDALAAIGMMAGGLAVIGGFMWTLAGYYLNSDTPSNDG